MDENSTAKIVVDAAYSVHSELGPGLLESVYETALCHELRTRQIEFARQRQIQILYKDLLIPDAFLADIIVVDKGIIELKSVECI